MLFALKRMSATGLIVISLSFALHQAAHARETGKKENQVAIEMKSHLGSYMAGRLARSIHDSSQAVAFYRQALRSSPDNPRIMTRAFLSEAMHGNFAEADSISRRLVAMQPDNRLAQLWLGTTEFRSGRYAAADKNFQLAARDPISELTSQLARAWVSLARNRQKEALRRLLPSVNRAWSAYYIQYHRALIADLSKRPSEAREIYRQIFRADARTPRTTAAYIRHAIHRGSYTLAGRTARRHMQISSNGGHASIAALFEDVKAGNKVKLMVQAPHDGLAEVFYGLGEALISEGGLELGTIYMQMALSLKPDFPFALAALANAHEATQNYSSAIAVYDSIRAGTPLEMEIAIRKAINLDAMGETDQAKQILDSIITANPSKTRPLEAMGNMLRTSKRYGEAIKYYSRLIKLVPKAEKRHWTYWYARGTSYERIKQWTKAEADLLRALELDPDQALILNYLGYSWVDQRVNLQRAFKMIEKAVALKPDDGYIVDSLGWAHYRLGNFDQAVIHLERAVELKPEDPILNDHLGDALWQVNRIREARYQWELALSLKPEVEEAVKIRKKLISGLQPQSDIKTAEQKVKRAANESGQIQPVR